jgi:5-(carboxyamino)imidazole ribonucleotide synthase
LILPGASLGVLGGGQLGRMFAIRARTMGYRVTILDPDPDSPAGAVADRHICASYDDPAALTRLADSCDAITTEFENVPAASLRTLALRRPVWPAAQSIAIAQDRIVEKEMLLRLGFAVAPFRPVLGADDLEAALREVGVPAILKTSRFGYDGKGQAAVGSLEEAQRAFHGFGRVPCVLERRLALELELSVVLARGADGELASFPPAENHHRNGILETSTLPARAPDALCREAQSLAERVATALDYVGVLGVELFVAEGGRLFVNEIAPRPHNSGHYTLDACSVDQFEQQVRALCGLPLGRPALLSPCSMINLLGDVWSAGEPAWDAALRLPGVLLHLYGKREPRPGRKMGHLTCLADNADEALRVAHSAHAALSHIPEPASCCSP